MNTFDALNIFYREDTISDFLISCFNNSKAFLDHFIQHTQIQPEGNATFQIDSRVGLGKNIGTPDIILHTGTKEAMTFIVIENKMGAAEGNEQTNRYEAIKAREMIATRYDTAIETSTYHFIFLALDTTVQPQNSQFTFLNYDLFLNGDWPLQNKTLQYLFGDFQAKLQDFYTPLKTPFESLTTNETLDSMQRKICWQTALFDSFQSVNEFILKWGVVGGSGRSNFLFLISKENWHSQYKYSEVGLAQTYYVHIDTYINLLEPTNKHVKEIGIRFETHPYKSHNNIKILADYDTFMHNKQDFGDRLLKKVTGEGIQFKRKNTKLLVMSVAITGTTIRELIQQMRQQSIVLQQWIDEVINDMTAEGLIK